MSEATIPTFDVVLPAPEVPKIDREQAAFRRMLPSLLATYAGKYVAVHDGVVVDADDNDVALVQRVHAKVRYVAIYVGLVSPTPPVVRMPRRREVVLVEGK